jgi:hypothetical protein
MERENVPDSWIGRRVWVITVATAERTTQEQGILLNLNQSGIAVRRPVIGGSEEEEVVFYPWVHVYQLGPLIE